MASNRVVHFEIPAHRPEALTKFYGDLFGWKFTKAPNSPVEYWLCDTGSAGPGINGAVARRQNAQQPPINYVDVADIDAAIEKATALGAQVALAKMPVPGVGAIGIIIDPQGEPVWAVAGGIVRIVSHEGAQRRGVTLSHGWPPIPRRSGQD
ncbi:MAG: lactoylglutathione lyase [Planctomycetia bacterium]|nr:lactoylglutathione lyase [Planctomycetia bacterium]